MFPFVCGRCFLSELGTRSLALGPMATFSFGVNWHHSTDVAGGYADLHQLSPAPQGLLLWDTERHVGGEDLLLERRKTWLGGEGTMVWTSWHVPEHVMQATKRVGFKRHSPRSAPGSSLGQAMSVSVALGTSAI